MRSQDHPRVQAAKDLLESWLLDVFNRTSDNCRRKIDELDFPFDVVPEAIEDWREKSLERITAGFERLFAVIRELQQDPGDALANIAKNLTWEVIDKAFNWTADDRRNSSRFKDWRTRAGAAFSVESEVLEMLEVSPGLDRDAPLVCDFQTQFEHLLNQLRNDAFSNTPTAQSTNTSVLAEPLAAGAPRHDQERETPSDEGDLDSRTRGIARARLVAKIKRELDLIRPDMFSMNDFEKLAEEHPDFIVFQVCRGNRQLLGSLEDLQSHTQYVWLAIAIAAAKLGKKPETIRTDWKRHKRFL